jgi:hypothetical protein
MPLCSARPVADEVKTATMTAVAGSSRMLIAHPQSA